MNDPFLGSIPSTTGPAQPGLLRAMNEQRIYEMIRELRPISRAELARRSGLSKPTVSLALRTLVDSGLVNAAGMESGKPGRAGLLFDPVADVCVAAAVTVTDDEVSCRIIDLDGAELAKASRHSPDVSTRDDIEPVRSVIDEAIQRCELPRERVVSAVVCVPGVVDPATGAAHWRDDDGHVRVVPIAEDLHQSTGMRVEVANRVHLAALGEFHEGAGRGHRHLMVASSGKRTSIASIVDGRLVTGARGGAGLRLPFGCSEIEHDATMTILITAGRIIEPELVVINEHVERGGAAHPLTDDELETLSRYLGEVPVVISELGHDAVRAGVDRLAIRSAGGIAFSSRMQRIAS